jgi:hypothetical protein
LVIKPLEEDSTPGTVKPVPVSLVEPVAYQVQLTQSVILLPCCQKYGIVMDTLDSRTKT